MSMSNRLYIGNLDRNATEDDIRQLFTEQGLAVDDVLLKNGYAFVDCTDQTSVDYAIDKLTEMQLHDKKIHVEPALAKQRNGCKLILKNVPPETDDEELKEICGGFGTIKDFSRQNDNVFITYTTAEQAILAKEKLYNYELKGHSLKVEFATKRSKQQMVNYPKQEFPLRLLVPYQYVGAIIGRSGQTIRNITQQTNARVDVVRRDNTLSAEKMVVILASQTENCIEACREILKVMASEADQSVQPKREPELRILAHNNLCGRLIGKQGVIIKAVMDETKTTITVSSVSSVSPLNQDRVVTIKGELADICVAAERIYSKLKSCYETDIQSHKYMPQILCPPGMLMPFSPFLRPPQLPIPGPFPMVVPHAHQPSGGGHMTCFLYIPKASVGAVIGSKGSYINFVKQESRASCQVQERADEPDANDRPVKITGYPECVWKAQWYIFDKVKSEGFTSNENTRLRCDVLIPKKMVGRIIGKGGRNVRLIQEISDAVIKLPEEQQTDSDDVPVQIFGHIYSQTLAQALIRQLLTQGQIQPVMAEGMLRAPNRVNAHHVTSASYTSLNQPSSSSAIGGGDAQE